MSELYESSTSQVRIFSSAFKSAIENEMNRWLSTNRNGLIIRDITVTCPRESVWIGMIWFEQFGE